MKSAHLRTIPLSSPEIIQSELPLSIENIEFVQKNRQNIMNILENKDPRLLIVVGPCSIHDPDAAYAYARQLKQLIDEVRETIYIVMRVYCEKPRTTSGWKGILFDPDLDETYKVEKGIRLTRTVMSEINQIGVPVGTEFLDPLTFYYYHDLVSWGSIGARTSSSQIHRQVASGLSIPIGFKNTTDGNIPNAINGMIAAKNPQAHIGLNAHGKASVIHTAGNQSTHLVLRGGVDEPNYDPLPFAYSLNILQKNHLCNRIMIDCSHDNSCKNYQSQPEVFDKVLNHYLEDKKHFLGLLLESFLFEGNQKIDHPSQLKYGVSITDACMGWESTKDLLLSAHERLLTTHPIFA